MYAQPGLLELTSSTRCEDCHRPLSNPHSRDRGYGPDCWGKTHTASPRTPRQPGWTQTGPDLIEDGKDADVEVRTAITQYTISAAPEQLDRHFGITVDRRKRPDGAPYWVVVWFGDYLGTDGSWTRGPSSPATAGEWWGSHEFDLETALALAEAAAPGVVVNGVRARDARWWDAR